MVVVALVLTPGLIEFAKTNRLTLHFFRSYFHQINTGYYSNALKSKLSVVFDRQVHCSTDISRSKAIQVLEF